MKNSNWYERFQKYAGDLYPGRYTPDFVKELQEQGEEIRRLADEKKSTIVVHNYLFPEFHEIADMVGDSLALSFFVRDNDKKRVDFCGVYFMAATAKIITGDIKRVFVSDHSRVLGCSLVFGTDYRWIERWKEQNPGGVVITYINSDPHLKAQSDYIATSRNAEAILRHAAKTYPGKKILFLPDKYLGWVMRSLAELTPEQVDVYDYSFGGYNASCYVHEKINPDALERSLENYPDAELLIHPECGCASTCLFKIQSGQIPHGKSFFLSTEQMIWHAKSSPAKEFVVGTETGMLYRLRSEVPEKIFHPVSGLIVCDFMKANTFPKLLKALKKDRIEIILCNDCCDSENPYEDDDVIHIPKSTAQKARLAINRMLEIA